MKRRHNEPLPSSPARPPTINIWFKWGPQHQRLNIMNACQRWAAANMIRVALNGRQFELMTDGWYITEDEHFMFRLVGDDVEGLLDDPPHEWQVPQPIRNELLRIAGEEEEKRPVEKEVRRTTTPRKKVSKEGLTTLQEICDEIKMDPRIARKTLRGKMQKPDAGWAWSPDEVDEIRKLLKK